MGGGPHLTPGGRTLTCCLRPSRDHHHGGAEWWGLLPHIPLQKQHFFSGKAKFLGSFLRGACVAAPSLPSSCLQASFGDLFQALPCIQAYLWGWGKLFCLVGMGVHGGHPRGRGMGGRRSISPGKPAPALPLCPAVPAQCLLQRFSEIHPRNIPFPLPRQGEHSCRLELLP